MRFTGFVENCGEESAWITFSSENWNAMRWQKQLMPRLSERKEEANECERSRVRGGQKTLRS